LNEQYEIETKSYDSFLQVHLREINTLNSHTPLLDIIILVHLDKDEYSLKCFEVNDGIKNEEKLTQLYSIKVEGPWKLKTLEIDLLKIVRKEFTTFKRQFYPL